MTSMRSSKVYEILSRSNDDCVSDIPKEQMTIEYEIFQGNK